MARSCSSSLSQTEFTQETIAAVVLVRPGIDGTTGRDWTSTKQLCPLTPTHLIRAVEWRRPAAAGSRQGESRIVTSMDVATILPEGVGVMRLEHMDSFPCKA